MGARHLSEQPLLCLGFHGDGVPHQRKRTVDVSSWNLLAFPGSERFLFGLVEKACMCERGCKGRCTIDAMLQLLVWCLRFLFMGRYPNRRHDGADWLPSDNSRAKMGGRSFGCHAILMQIRGDWQFYKQVFGFSGWASKNICWLCGATQADGEMAMRHTRIFHCVRSGEHVDTR